MPAHWQCPPNYSSIFTFIGLPDFVCPRLRLVVSIRQEQSNEVVKIKISLIVRFNDFRHTTDTAAGENAELLTSSSKPQ